MDGCNSDDDESVAYSMNELLSELHSSLWWWVMKVTTEAQTWH